MNAIKKQFIFAFGILVFYFIITTSVYFHFGDPATTYKDALYMTVISFTTVGYGDAGFASTDHQKMIFLPFVIIGFLIQIIFVASVINAFVAMKIHIRFEEIIMKFQLKLTRNHIVIFGIGKVTPHIVDELTKVKADFVVVENNVQKIDSMKEEFTKINIIQLPGKTINNRILREANIDHARAAIFDMGSDEMNHIAGDMVRRRNSDIRIIAVNDHLEFLPIMEGDRKNAVNKHILCAMRVASLAFRPSIVNFLDNMLYMKDGVYRIEEIHIREHSDLIGKNLKELFRHTRLQVLVIGIKDHELFDIIPKGELIIKEGMVLFVQGEVNQIKELEKLGNGEKRLADFA